MGATEPGFARVLLFAKAPVPGLVKTRLVPALGKRGAAALYRRMLVHIAAELAGEFDVRVYRHGDPDHGVWQEMADAGVAGFYPQRGADLGQRMANAITEQLGLGAEQVFLVGGDCPALDTPYLRLAGSALAGGRDAVIGPASDGGYVLLGLTRLWPEMFADKAWGSGTVLADTLASCRALAIDYALLDPLSDIDRPGDLPKLPASLLADV
jgi:rSAM/selenodomain-associated transferase 1